MSKATKKTEKSLCNSEQQLSLLSEEAEIKAPKQNMPQTAGASLTWDPAAERIETVKLFEEAQVVIEQGSVSSLPNSLPSTYVAPKDHATNYAFSDKWEVGKVETITTIPTQHKTIQVRIDYDEILSDGIAIENSQKLSPFDKSVHNAIVTSLKNGERSFTVQRLNRIIHGGNRNVRVSTARQKAIIHSIEKMQRLRVFIDATRDTFPNASPTDKHIIYESMISVRTHFIQHGKYQVVLYELYAVPPLLAYAEKKNQIWRVPIEALALSEDNLGESEIIIREYLLERILSTDKLSSVIKMERIYERLGIQKSELSVNAYKGQTKRARYSCISLLDDWVKRGFLEEYEMIKKGRSVIAVQLGTWHNNPLKRINKVL